MPSLVTVADIIDQARDFNRSFDRGTFPERVLMRQLSRAEKRIVQKTVALSELALAEVVTFRSLDLALMRGLDLPQHVFLAEVSLDRNGVLYPVSLVAYTDRFTEGLRRFPAAYLIGNRLYPINRTEAGELNTGWDDVSLIKVVLVKSPVPHASASEVISLPDIAEDALVSNLAHWMAMRVGLPETNILYGQAQEAENTLVQTLVGRGESSPWQVRITHY